MKKITSCFDKCAVLTLSYFSKNNSGGKKEDWHELTGPKIILHVQLLKEAAGALDIQRGMKTSLGGCNPTRTFLQNLGHILKMWIFTRHL